MKKNVLGTIFSVLLILVVGGLFAYFFITLNRVDKKLDALQTTITQDSGKISSIVSFFNANLNAQNTNK